MNEIQRQEHRTVLFNLPTPQNKIKIKQASKLKDYQFSHLAKTLEALSVIRLDRN